MNDLRLTVKDFADAFGVTTADINRECRKLIDEFDFRYRKLDAVERDRLILSILNRIEADTQIIGAPGRHDVWEKGWAQNLKEFEESGYDLSKLVPKFIRPNQPVRLNQDYVMPNSSNFELDYVSVLRSWFFRYYFDSYTHVYEFGCGTGFNLVALAQLDPTKELHGLDFVQSSVDLVNKIGQVHSLKLHGHLFDMINPDEGLEMEEHAAVFTFGALEQLASKFENFLQFLLKRSPGICLHIEPTVELYDENNLVDHLAIRFHRKRGYTEGLIARLQELEADGKVELLKMKRLQFGSLFLEGYSLIVWRPVR